LGTENKVSSRRVGLDIGLAIGRFFLNTEDLHYGYWPKGKTATIQNFVEAQEAHSKLIMEYIPHGTQRILDVGSGSGNLALKLINNSFQVACVIPSEFLAEQVQAKLAKSLEKITTMLNIGGHLLICDCKIGKIFRENNKYAKYWWTFNHL